MAGGRSSQGADSGDDEGESGRKSLIISPELAGEDFARVLRTICIVGRRPTLEQLAELSGVKAERLEKFVRNDGLERRLPNLAELLSIWAVLREPAVNVALDRIDMVAESREVVLTRLGEALAGMAGAMATLAHVAADGRVRREEITAAVRAADEVQAQAMVFRVAAEKARGA